MTDQCKGQKGQNYEAMNLQQMLIPPNNGSFENNWCAPFF